MGDRGRGGSRTLNGGRTVDVEAERYPVRMPHDPTSELAAAVTAPLQRRRFLRTLGVGSAALAVNPVALPSPAAERRRTLRFAHGTDLHVLAERNAPKGVEAWLAHVQAAPQSAEMILTGGDLIFDSFETSLGVARDRWDLLKRLLKEHCRIPIEHCLGNHDLWGWCAAKCGSNGSEAEWGSGLARTELGLEREWRSFDRGGWHFIVLHSVAPDPANPCGYLGLLGEEQLAWLAADLAAARTPTVVVSHIPIVSVTPMTRGNSFRGKDQRASISGGMQHLDAQPIHRLFRESGRVKLVLSGHTHLIDRCETDGVTYCCDGAVCGGWWQSNPNHCPPCYALVDLFDDGTFDHRMVEYGWTNP